MVKLEDINFTKVKDKEILAIDFTNTVTKIQVKKGDNIGFITEDGRKGIMNIAGASGRYIDFKCKTQTSPIIRGGFWASYYCRYLGRKMVTGRKAARLLY